MDYVYILAAIAAGIHTLSYGVWIMKQGNKVGAIFLYGLVMLSIGLTVHKIMTSP